MIQMYYEGTSRVTWLDLSILGVCQWFCYSFAHGNVSFPATFYNPPFGVTSCQMLHEYHGASCGFTDAYSPPLRTRQSYAHNHQNKTCYLSVYQTVCKMHHKNVRVRRILESKHQIMQVIERACQGMSFDHPDSPCIRGSHLQSRRTYTIVALAFTEFFGSRLEGNVQISPFRIPANSHCVHSLSSVLPRPIIGPIYSTHDKLFV